MPSKEKSYDWVDSQSSCELNNSRKTSSQMSSNSNGHGSKRSELQSSSGSDSERKSNPSNSQRSTKDSQITNSQQSNNSTTSVGSKKSLLQSPKSNKSGDSNSDSSQQNENTPRSDVTNSQRSNKSISSVSSKKIQLQSQNSRKSGSDSDSISHSSAKISQGSKITNSQQSNKSTSTVISQKSQSQSQNSNKSGFDSDPNLDDSQQMSPNHSVTNSQKSAVRKDSLKSKRLGYSSDSDDQDSAQNSAIKTCRPLDDSDSDSIISSNKKKTMSKSAIRKLLEDDSNSASDSKNSTLKMTELASDSSNKSSSDSINKKNKNLKSKRRIVKHVESGSSDEETSAVRKTVSTKSSMTFSTDTGLGTAMPNWKKGMGTGLLDDSSSEDERGLLPSPVHSSEADTMQSPKVQNKKFRKTKEKSANSTSKKSAKVAKQDAEDIHSHSQRHRRVERAELPYHVPRQRSLAEFMARRQALPAATSKSLKMPAWQLKAHWKQMAEQEKEATEFFKSESDQSGDETQVSAILSKDLQNKLIDQEKSKIENIIKETSPKKSEEVHNSAPSLTDVNVENNEATGVDDVGTVKTCLANACGQEIVQAAPTTAPENDLQTVDEKVKIVPEIDSFETPSCKHESLSTESNKLNDEVEPILEKPENITEMNKVDKDNDYSSDSDVALRLSDSEEDKEKERPPIKTETKRALSTELKLKKETVITKPAFGAGFSDLISSDSDNELGSNCKSASVLEKNKDDLGDKKLAMLRRRGLVDVVNIKPRLSGNKNDIIDLDQDLTSKRDGVMDLMQRFLKHSSKKKPRVGNTQMELSIVSAEKGADGMENVKKELVTILLGDEEQARDPVPGAKLQRLKKTLQKQMALKRNADWERKLEEKRINSEVLGDGETSDCGMLDEETEMTDSEDGAEENIDDEEAEEEVDDEEADDEEEEEEIDLPIKEKKRSQSEFFDEEADESDGGDADVSDDEDEEEINEDGKGSDKEDEGKIFDDSIDKLISKGGIAAKNTQPKSKFKRLQTFDMFDSDDDLETSIVDKWAVMETQDATTPTSPLIPAGQGTKSPVESQYLVSPMTFNRRSAPTQESPIASPLLNVASSKTDDEHCIASTQYYLNEIMKGTTAKPKEVSHVSSLSKFLFRADARKTQAEEDELLSLCSGKFHTQIDKSADDELAELCSGRFPSQTQIENRDEPEAKSQTEADDENFSQDSREVNLEVQSQVGESGTVTSSQKIPLSTGKAVVKPRVDLEIVSTDDEEEAQFNHSDTNLKKKTQKKLNFSDDEDEDEEGEDQVDEDEVGAESANEVDPELVDYDSEENEVPLDGEKKKQAAKEFFDAEAELTESEWGSADEDEKDLDKLDYAAADEEHFDQDQMKEQLDKIHMRQVLDADKREVRMLQEMLFEDGDLHSEGGGRERKFRWRNVGNDDMNVGLRGDSGDEGRGDEDEAEDEEKWRIMRHERETFLREQKEKAEAAGKEDQGILEDDDSQFLKLGKAALRRIRSVHSQEQIAIERKITLRNTVSDGLLSPDAKRKCNPVVQRGSFLARGETALARIAAITRGTTGKVVLNAKNSRNFVFATISPKEEELEEPVKVPGKRKAPAVTPTLIKKTKVVEVKSTGRRLFDHLE